MEINSIMSRRSPPAYDTLTLIAIQVQQTKRKNKTKIMYYIIKPGSNNILFHTGRLLVTTKPLHGI